LALAWAIRAGKVDSIVATAVRRRVMYQTRNPHRAIRKAINSPRRRERMTIERVFI
jgi:hypothetical protein